LLVHHEAKSAAERVTVLSKTDKAKTSAVAQANPFRPRDANR
jgi:hypothetical protein